MTWSRSSRHSGLTTFSPSSDWVGCVEGIGARFHLAHHAHDVADGNAAAFPGQSVTAPGAANADQDVLAHQALQRLFQVAPGDALAAGDLAALHGPGAGVVGDVQDRLDGVQGLLGKAQHG